MIEKYRVITTFCDDVVMKHDYEAADVRDATSEYSNALADAILMDGKQAASNPVRHIRTVELHALDDNEETVRSIDSGTFPCEDRA